jgi:hypothetical protein
MPAEESSYPRAQKFTITNFIENRWSEAKQELAEHDPAFFPAIETHYSTKEEEPILSGNPPAPSYRLSERWYHVLETTVDVSQQLERLRRTVFKARSATNRQEALYYFDTWIADVYSLCEKVKVLVAQSCRLHSLGNKAINQYRGEIENEVQKNAGRMRHALVHGKDEPKAGGLGINAKAITQDKSWEMLVVAGPSIIDQYLLTPGGDNMPPERILRLPSITTEILARIGATLYDLDQAITNTKSSNALSKADGSTSSPRTGQTRSP